MQLKEKLSQLEKNVPFTSWKKDHTNSYLAHVFRMLDEANKDIWQFGYYNKDDTITTFIVENDSVKEVPQQNIFKKENVLVPKLDVSIIKIDFDEAFSKAQKIHGEKYKQHPVLKVFAILQKIKENQVYNITFVTQTFNTLNIRVDTTTGDIIHEKIVSLMDMAKFEKGEGDKYRGKEYIG